MCTHVYHTCTSLCITVEMLKYAHKIDCFTELEIQNVQLQQTTTCEQVKKTTITCVVHIHVDELLIHGTFQGTYMLYHQHISNILCTVQYGTT